MISVKTFKYLVFLMSLTAGCLPNKYHDVVRNCTKFALQAVSDQRRHNFLLAILEPEGSVGTFSTKHVTVQKGDDVSLTCDIPVQGSYRSPPDWLAGDHFKESYFIDEATGETKLKLFISDLRVRNSGSQYMTQNIVLDVLPSPRNMRIIYGQWGTNVTLGCPVNITGDLTMLRWWSEFGLLGYYNVSTPGSKPEKLSDWKSREWYEISWAENNWYLHIIDFDYQYSGEYICSLRFKDGRKERRFYQLHVTMDNQTFYDAQYIIG